MTPCGGLSLTRQGLDSHYGTTWLLRKFDTRTGTLPYAAVDPHPVIFPKQHFEAFIYIVNADADTASFVETLELGLRNSHAVVFNQDLQASVIHTRAHP